ncbi:MAG: hypothetical protein KAS32_09875, partial [Candidatus Peribacteraceae bacterium]|nr:hypothetical protein [Candidatus Peribacteraceae bacterium]
FKACGEVGRWEVQHPLYGGLQLQLIGYNQGIQPVTQGGLTEFNLSFFQPADADIIESKQQLLGNVKAAIDKASAASIGKFADAVSNISSKAQAGLAAVVDVATTAVDSILGPIAQINSEINSSFLAIQRGIDETLAAVILDPLALAGQVVNLIETPSQIVLSTQEKLNAYKALAQELFNIESEEPAVLEVKEIYLGATSSAIAGIAAATDAQLSTTVLTQMVDIVENFDAMIVSLEADQSKFLDLPMDEQYVSMVGTFSQYYITTAYALRSMIKSSLELAIEKRFILQKYTSPLMLTINEYNTDDKLDFLIETNDLSGTEIVLLPPGKEIVIYQAFA